MPTEKTLTGYPSIDKPWLKYYSENAAQYVTDRIEQSAYQCILEANKERMHYIALECFGVKSTYGELFKKIEKTAKALRSYGIGKVIM
ncbi:MAG: hypothetical protein J1E35_10050 [Lachnospiraceae bacterium]|nr:hypothetical protein [Lachnospiraceae bacterium]